MANKAFKTTCGDLFKFDPDEILLNDPGDSSLWDERDKLPVLESMVLSIMAGGVIQPISLGKTDDGQPYVIDGRQRVRAAREAKARIKASGSKEILRVECTYKKRSTLASYLAMCSANEHRQDDGPLEKAKKLERSLGLGATEEEAAIAFGVSLQTIKNWGKLLDVAPEVKKAVKAGKLGATAAGKLAALPKAEQVDGLQKLIDSPHKPTVKRAQKVAKKSPLEGRKPRVRSRAVIEAAMAHNTTIIESLGVMGALFWVLGKDVDGLEG